MRSSYFLLAVNVSAVQSRCCSFVVRGRHNNWKQNGTEKQKLWLDSRAAFFEYYSAKFSCNFVRILDLNLDLGISYSIEIPESVSRL